MEDFTSTSDRCGLILNNDCVGYGASRIGHLWRDILTCFMLKTGAKSIHFIIYLMYQVKSNFDVNIIIKKMGILLKK